jgi:RNA 2',3'-cyclic 3'-phosphodiesterase
LRLFVALWPDAGALTWLRTCSAVIGWPPGSAPEDESRWHATLHFLGAVPRSQLAELLPALQRPFAPFPVELGRLAAWPRGLVVVEPTQPVPELIALHAALGGALRHAGLRLDARAWRPHVTLARRAAAALLPAAPPPQRWQVAEFALVNSAGGHYRTLATYPRGRLNASAAPSTATPQTPPVPPPTPR